MPKGFWKLYASMIGYTVALLAAGAGMNLLAYGIAVLLGVHSGWVILAMLCLIAAGGMALIAYMRAQFEVERADRHAKAADRHAKEDAYRSHLGGSR